ncbi:hypothetical protein NZK35_29915, partial [Stieleria sp. ICT_E10.1]|uniref:hypothetical protein n=1 Tax=Stieleria sedimenti TaxID=2976331 RepID=UPI0021808070
MRRRNAHRSTRQRTVLSKQLRRPTLRPRLERLEDRRVLAAVSGLITSNMTFTDPADPVEFVADTTIASGVKLEVGANVPIRIPENVNIYVDGMLKFDHAAGVEITDGFGGQNSGIVVNGTGTLDIDDTDFTRRTVSNATDQTRIAVVAGGQFMAADSRFSWDLISLNDGSLISDPTTEWLQGNEFNQTIRVPYTHLQDPSHLGGNLRFEDIEILAGSLPTGETLNLNQIGTATTVNLRYVFPSGFTTQAGAMLSVNQDVSVLLKENQQLIVDGVLKFDNADSVTIEDGANGNTSGILVNGTGTLDVVNTDFWRLGISNTTDRTRIAVAAGGIFKAVDSRFDWDSLTLADGSHISDGPTAWVERNEFTQPITVSYTHLQAPAHLANNLRFEDIEIYGGSLPTGETLNLNQIGTATTVNLR